MVLLALARLRGASSGDVARRLWIKQCPCASAFVVTYVGAFLAGDPSTIGVSVGWGLMALGLAEFSLAMKSWSIIARAGDDLVRAWQRTAVWSVGCALMMLTAGVVRIIQLAWSGRPLDSTIEVHGWAVLLLMLAVIVGFAPLLSVAGSTSRTRETVGPLRAGTTRPRRRSLTTTTTTLIAPSRRLPKPPWRSSNGAGPSLARLRCGDDWTRTPTTSACNALRGVRGGTFPTIALQVRRGAVTVAVQADPPTGLMDWLPCWLPGSGGAGRDLRSLRGNDAPAGGIRTRGSHHRLHNSHELLGMPSLTAERRRDEP